MRLCDLDALMDELKNNRPLNWTDSDCEIQEQYDWNRFEDMVSDAPTIDAVPVVRCKDCKHFAACDDIDGVSWTGFCNYGEFHTDEDDFCSRGERKDGEGA